MNKIIKLVVVAVSCSGLLGCRKSDANQDYKSKYKYLPPGSYSIETNLEDALVFGATIRTIPPPSYRWWNSGGVAGGQPKKTYNQAVEDCWSEYVSLFAQIEPYGSITAREARENERAARR